MSEFLNQVAIVTGSTSGIGEATARRLVKLGAKVVLNSSSSVEQGELLSSELGDSVTYFQADISDEDACLDLVNSTLDTFGKLDILVNNAGFTSVIPHSDLDGVSEEVFRRIIDVNIFGTWYLSRAAVPELKKSENGNIVNISSIAGLRPVGLSLIHI